MNKTFAIAVTGHRLQKMDNTSEEKVKIHMGKVLDTFEWPFDVLSGMAIGIDQWFAETALKQNIPVIAAIPFQGFQERWNLELQNNFQKLLDQCAKKVYIGTEFSKGIYQRRNEWLVDHCDLLVAYYTGQPGGTKNCIEYARKQKREILIYNPNEI